MNECVERWLYAMGATSKISGATLVPLNQSTTLLLSSIMSEVERGCSAWTLRSPYTISIYQAENREILIGKVNSEKNIVKFHFLPYRKIK